MNAILRTLAVAACVAVPLDVAAAETGATAPIPLSTFFKKSATTGAALSPNGRFVALRMLSAHGRTMLTVFDVATRKSQAIANFRNADIDMFSWLSDERLVFTLVTVDHEGDAGRPGAYAVNRDGKERISLTEILVAKRSFADSDPVNHDYPTQFSRRGFPLRKGETLDAIEHDGDDEASLVRLNSRNARRFPVRAPSGTYNWLTDADGNLRVATAKRGGRVLNLYHDNGDWRQLDSRDAQAESSFDPLLYVDGVLYVRSRNGGDEAQVYRYDLAHNAIAAKPLITAPRLRHGRLFHHQQQADAGLPLHHRRRGHRLVRPADESAPAGGRPDPPRHGEQPVARHCQRDALCAGRRVCRRAQPRLHPLQH
ncbi:hypothetical protein [Massilia sp. Root351]|uniref:hypothetical protein n=1 Tax=Massilia sp. Root351 TaxID=1736522 RepID=UPI001E40C85C|nr:hypothetical protein [Massilia sp. Root351]